MPKIIIVYDIDDVLNNLTEKIWQTTGIDGSKQDRFNIWECKHFTAEEQKTIIDMFEDTEVFKSVDLVPGATDIMRFEKPGVEVHINSNNFNNAIALIKLAQIMREIPAMPEERIHMQVGLNANKQPIPGTTVIVEDNLPALRKYTGAKLKILIDKPYNKAANYDTTDEEEQLVRVPTLLAANALIENFLKENNA